MTALIAPESSPALIAPRIVSGPTLLTGICFCAGCGMAMTLRTGKSARYKYYTCSAKARQGETGCPGRTVSMEKLDTVVAEHIEHRLLQPQRLEQILSSVLDRREERTERRKVHITELRKRASEADAKLKRLYDAIENGFADLSDPMLKDRIARAEGHSRPGPPGGGHDAMVADLSNLAAAIAPVAGVRIAFVADNASAVKILLRRTASLPFPVYASSALTAKTVVAIALNALVVGGSDQAPRFDISRDATLIMDSDPKPFSVDGTPAATDCYRKMLHECERCDQWWELHSELYDELQLRPWEWPAVVEPDAEICETPKGSVRADWRQKGSLVARATTASL